MATNPLVEAMRRQNGEQPYAPASSNVTHGAAFGVYRRPETAGTRPGMMQPYAATGPRSFEPAKSLDASSMRMNAASDPRSLTFGGSTPEAASPYAGVGYRPPAPPSTSSASTAAPPAVPTAPPQAPSADFSAVNDFSQAPAPAPAVAPALAQAATPMAPSGAVTRDGNSYSGPAGISGDITINGKPPGGTMNSLPSGATPGSQMQGIAPGLSSSLGNPLVQAAGIRHSGNDWQSRNELRNAEVSASSITNSRRFGGRGAENSPDMQRYRAALGTDAALRQADPAMQIEGMRQGNALVRAAMEQQGQNQRAGMQAGLTQQRLDMDRETQGYTNRTNRLVEAARNQVSQEQDPTKRRSLVQYMRDIEGAQTPSDWDVKVTPTTKNLDGSTSMGSVIRHNRATGQVEQVPMGQGGGDPLSSPATRPVGTVSSVGGKTAVWDGQKWVPQ
ncbi:hypothetical protein DelCs14_2689 [Delftia sp. Cs1-4]|uniref:hypothetical protein n=1 Tax=Delftia sp. (strain Cs1-4) TaxID=742013 RepID=UPI00020E82ED|nr:hypothetical protein [Delftia sp. Cs1-4]AEF89701.1 hypothetical protein DelCs14_2689 [Delftia sp. Cs1-4]